ncbi:tereporin-Ca1-like [Babylonia areolata]|uniref:tereporin-Ca1-like n=1 Tax=Babylonia areolata TaxID=304850 RepID=UPI003FD1D417
MKFVNQALTPTIVGSVVAGVTVAVMEFVFGWHWAVVLAGLLSLVVYAVGKYHPAVQRFFCTGAESIGNTATNPATSITAGTSLEGTSTLALLQDGYRVTCGVEVENWTCHPLTLPHVQLGRGTLTLAPSAVAPATREVMVARKISGLAEGTFGTVSWLIQPMNRRLVVMWSAPFNFNHFSNWLGVGLTGEDVIAHAPGNDWFDQMYYGESTPQLQFERGEYYADIRPVVCRDADFEVEGIMGSDHKAVVKVILRPQDPKNFARSIKEKMKVA